MKIKYNTPLINSWERKSIKLLSCILAMIALVAILLVTVFIVSSKRDGLEQEAVDRGFAEWVGTEFKWKEKDNE